MIFIWKSSANIIYKQSGKQQRKLERTHTGHAENLYIQRSVRHLFPH